MTHPTFSVRLDELSATAQRLSVLEDHLAQATGRMRHAADPDARDVARGLDDFARHWERGLHDLHHTVHELRAALTVAHDGYGDHERGLSAALHGRR